MPLPPAPTKRASLLVPASFNLSSSAHPDPARNRVAAQASHKPEAKLERQASADSTRPRARAGTERLNASPTPKRPASVQKTSKLDASQQEISQASYHNDSVNTYTPVAVSAQKAKRVKVNGPAKLFVLDTNVLMHDPMCLFRFEEHDIYLPMIVLEELDGHKKGMTEVARNARQTSRSLDALAAAKGADMTLGLQLDTTGHREAKGRLFFQTQTLDYSLPLSLPQGKADNQILGVVEALRQVHAKTGSVAETAHREVVLVSKDINMRVKARALGLPAEDYQNDKTLEDGDLLYAGALPLPPDFWTKQAKHVESWQEGHTTFYRLSGPLVPSMMVNQFVYFEAPGEPSLYARVVEVRPQTVVLKTLKDYKHLKNVVWGVAARNREQNFAMNLLMDPEVDFVTLAGTAGTGKTLMALACGLTQVLDDRRYTEIIMTRATVSVGEDIGFLPGTEEEKMGPWMGAMDDNLEVLAKTETTAGEWGRAATNELIRSRIKVKSMNFMRGRTFLNKYVIIDEAQNLTPKQMKTLITRAGPGTKIVCMGNLAQIDTPYLTEGSSGMTYAVDKFKGWPHGGHITLARGERSRLADFASEVL